MAIIRKGALESARESWVGLSPETVWYICYAISASSAKPDGGKGETGVWWVADLEWSYNRIPLQRPTPYRDGE